MTSAGWTVVHADASFTRRLLACHQELDRDLAGSSLDQAQFDGAVRRWKRFKPFILAIDALRAHIDPAAVLKPVYDEDGDIIANYAVLRVGKFAAYYRLDLAIHVCTGVLVKLEQDAPLANPWKLLSDAFSGYERKEE